MKTRTYLLLLIAAALLNTMLEGMANIAIQFIICVLLVPLSVTMDKEAQKNIIHVPMADPEDKSNVGASIPGAISQIKVKVGDKVEEGQTLVVIEAMKMEINAQALMGGEVAEILVKEGDTVKGGQLLVRIK